MAGGCRWNQCALACGSMPMVERPVESRLLHPVSESDLARAPNERTRLEG